MNNEKEHDLTKKMLKTLNEAKNAKTVSGLIKEPCTSKGISIHTGPGRPDLAR